MKISEFRVLFRVAHIKCKVESDKVYKASETDHKEYYRACWKI